MKPGQEQQRVALRLLLSRRGLPGETDRILKDRRKNVSVRLGRRQGKEGRLDRGRLVHLGVIPVLVWAVITNYHRPCGLNNRHSFFTVPEAGSLRPGCQQGQILGEGHALAVSSNGGERASWLSGLF